MKYGDTEPSIIFLGYAKPNKKENLLKDLADKNIVARELFFIDVSIPLERKDEILNYFKEFIWFEYMKSRSPIRLLDNLPKVMGINVANKLREYFKSSLYEFFDYSKFKEWKRLNTHQHNNVMLFPIAWQSSNIQHCEDQWEQEVFKEIGEFKTND